LLTIVVAYLAFIGLGLTSGLVGSSWLQMQTEFAVPVDWLGLLLVASVAGYLTASFLIGTMTTRFGSGRMFVVGGALLAVGLLGTMTAQQWWLLVVVQFIAGLGSGTIDSGLNVYLAQHHGARAMNWLHACFGVGWTFSPLIIREALTAGQSWRVGFGFVAGYVILVAIFFLVTIRWWKSVVVQDEKAPAAERKSIWATLRMPVVLMGILMFFLYAGVEATPGSWGATYFTKGRGLPETDALTWVAIYVGSFTIGRIFFGAIITRLKQITLLRACMGVAAVAALLLWWNPVDWLGFVGLIVLGFSQAPLFPVLISATPARVGVQNAPNAIGFQVAGAGLGVALLPGFAGILVTSIQPGVERLDVIPPFIFFAAVLMIILHEVSIRQGARIRQQQALAAAGD
jgi:fucose permease